MENVQGRKETTPTHSDHSGYLCLNVGGTVRRVERALIGLAPVDSRAHTYLAPPEAYDAVRFVDERPEHFARMVDCLRHGMGGLDFMHPYDAAVVQSLLGSRDAAAVDVLASPAATDKRTTNDDKDLEIMQLLVDGVGVVDIARSTLDSRHPMVPRDSLLARMASRDRRWSPGTQGDRLSIDQNRRHFDLLLDCLRHGTRNLARLDDLYDLWGVRALGVYYGIDAVRDAAQLAIGWRGYLAAHESHRCTTTVVGSDTLPVSPRCVPVGVQAEAATRFMHSSHASVADVVALAAAAVGMSPDAIVAYVSPYGDRWRPLVSDDTKEYHEYTAYRHQSDRISVVLVEARSDAPATVAAHRSASLPL